VIKFPSNIPVTEEAKEVIT
jgi:hypothetical protein